MSAENKIAELGLELPPPPPPGGIYQPVVIAGNIAYVSGHGPLKNDGAYITGRVGRELDLADGQAAARQTGLALLSTIRQQLGSLDRVRRLLKTLALVNSTDDFTQQPQVINGFSELFRDVFGEENGVGARSALGTSVLPGNIPVEIELILEIEP
ncbi:MAG: RidA family protein [Akkermansiaceae bacterium]|nr:RidA family protein [Akkermansiaceae bacterium]MCP5550194.1 RidA family protein [Akkermansiaceae bacterium]